MICFGGMHQYEAEEEMIYKTSKFTLKTQISLPPHNLFLGQEVVTEDNFRKI